MTRIYYEEMTGEIVRRVDVLRNGDVDVHINTRRCDEGKKAALRALAGKSR